MKVFTIPKRSPDLNVLDYSIWSEVERRMRNQEQRWPETKRETREEFGVRLNRTAKNLSPKFVNAAICNKKVRCERLYKAKGGLFEEGGRSKKN